RFGGVGSAAALSVAVDGSGNVYTTGDFSGMADFDPGVGTLNLTSSGYRDVFVSKLSSSGDLLWAKAFGGINYDDTAVSVAVDGSGNVYTTGDFSGSADFDPGVGTLNLTSSGYSDGFVSKLSSSGDLLWAKRFGGTATVEGRSIAVDGSGNVYTTGYFQGTADFDPGVGTLNLTSSGSDVFVLKLSSSGDLVWAKAFGGTDLNEAFSVAVGGSGNVYATGYFRGTVDFDPGVGTLNLTSSGYRDGFVSKLSSSGDLVWAKRFGGTAAVEARSIAVDGSGNVYTTGYFQGTVDFDPGAGTSTLTSAGEGDVFVARLTAVGETTLTPITTAPATPSTASAPTTTTTSVAMGSTQNSVATTLAQSKPSTSTTTTTKPLPPPGKVLGVTVDWNPKKPDVARISWKPPKNGRKTSLKYTVYARQNASAFCATTKLSCWVQLAEGEKHTFIVEASNGSDRSSSKPSRTINVPLPKEIMDERT
ncbi:MAG: hypothetical protein FJ267_13240, partial [Planctomycetes bacterium]|nr:hypothetical protein [Planctomycetota bacterium]